MLIFCSDLFVERHENVSILFADIVNFTPLTVKLKADELVETLNELFGRFDAAAMVCKEIFCFKHIMKSHTQQLVHILLIYILSKHFRNFEKITAALRRRLFRYIQLG